MNTATVCFCMLILSSVTNWVQAFENETTTDFVSIPCCEMLKTLTQYTVQSTGDSVRSQCEDNECVKLKIVQLFVNHAQKLLGNGETSFDQAYIKVSRNALLDNSPKMLVLALLGQASIPEKLRDQSLSLEYNQASDVFFVKDSTCTTDKTIYSTIIIASIALLLFFIATTIIQSEQRMHSTQHKQEIAGPFQPKMQQVSNMHFLRMSSDSKQFFCS